MATRNKKSKTVKFRISTEALGAANARALRYFNGDLSKWVRWCLDNSLPPKKKKAP